MLVIVAIIFVCLRLQHSRIGRAWHAIREDEDVARAMGINVRNYKLLAFAMGASFGGVAGRCSAHFRALSRRNPSPCRSRLPYWRWWCWAGWDTSPA
jgi:ABC-type branched-subunit amino acid transport system permease subunit